jgi:hypothetical protein
MSAARRPLAARQTILNVIGDLLVYGCQVEEFLLDEGTFGFFGKLPIHGRLFAMVAGSRSPWAWRGSYFGDRLCRLALFSLVSGGRYGDLSSGVLQTSRGEMEASF